MPPMGGRPEMPEGFEPGERPEMPEGFEPGERPEMPEGFKPGERPEMPEGFEPGEKPKMSDDFNPDEIRQFPGHIARPESLGKINTDYVSFIFTIDEGDNHFLILQPTTVP